MLTYALIAFGIAAVGGLVLANNVLRGKFAPWSVSVLHGALGATGLVLLLLAAMDGGNTMAQSALGIFLIAALGGFYLASLHLRKKLAPRGIVIVHALVAVSGFLLLAAIVFAVV